MRDDYCTAFPEKVEGIEIGQTCCRQHDNQVGRAGTYNPITPHINFYKCLKNSGVSIPLTILITFGGTVFSIYKYPWLAYNKYKWRKREDWDGIIK